MTTVLVVDDDIGLTSLAAKRLTDHGYAVHTAGSSQEAFERAKQLKPDIVLLDVMLGNSLGYELCRAFRKDPECYRMAIVFQSALKDKREVQYAIEQGGDAYLIKPYTEQALLARLELMGKLITETGERDPVTGMLSLARMRREIEHRLMREESFALCYSWLEESVPGTVSRTAPAVQQAIRITADILFHVIHDCRFKDSHLCRLAGAHFIALLPLEGKKEFIDLLRQTYTKTRNQPITQSTAATNPLRGLELMSSGTHTGHKEYTHAAAMLHDLQKLAEKREEHAVEENERSHRRYGHEHWVDF